MFAFGDIDADGQPPSHSDTAEIVFVCIKKAEEERLLFCFFVVRDARCVQRVAGFRWILRINVAAK